MIYQNNPYLRVREIAVIMGRNYNSIRKYFDRAEFAPYRIYISKNKLLILWCSETQTMLQRLLSKSAKISAAKKKYYENKKLSNN